MILLNGEIWDVHVLVSLALMAASLTYLMFLMVVSRIAPHYEKPGAQRAVNNMQVIYVIPCLNEALVIGRSVDRLLQAHPGAHVLVVNDGSDDETGDIVASKNHPQVHVLTRTAPHARQGKGEALNAAYQHILAGNVLNVRDPEQVVVVVVDADGRLEDGVADHVIPRFAADPSIGAVQIGVRIVNRGSSLLARMQDVEFALYTELYQRGRRHLGSVGLGGNGQFVRLAALEDLGDSPWSKCLTEDLDLGVRLLVNNWRMDYCHTTSVHQQGLVDLKRWVKQRTRWFQGYLQSWTLIPVVLRSLPTMTRTDLLFHLTSPFVTLMSSVYCVSFILGAVTALDDLTYGRFALQPWWIVMYLLMFAPALLFGFVIYRPLDRRPGIAGVDDAQRSKVGIFKLIGIMHAYPIYSQLWFVAGWKAAWRMMRGQTGWAKTERIKEAPAVVASEGAS